jgi:hypothetical protein
MRAVDAIHANMCSYTSDVGLPISYKNEYKTLECIYQKHLSYIISSPLRIPKYWAPHILRVVRELLYINHKLRFIDLREENSKLILNLHYPGAVDENITKRIRKVKNFIDTFVHAKVEKCGITRRLQNATSCF